MFKKITTKILDFLFPRSKIQKKLDNITIEEFYLGARKTTCKNKKTPKINSVKQKINNTIN